MKRWLFWIMGSAGVALLTACHSATATGAPRTAAAPTPVAAAPTATASQVKPKIFVPCGMIQALRTVQEAYEKDTGVRLALTFENAPVMLNMIRSGAKCDVLLTPGRLEMEQMEKEQKIDPQSVVTFGSFKLIVVVPANNPAGIKSWQDLSSPRVKAVGVADASQNSVGWYADQSLQKLGLLDKLEGRIQRNWHAKTAVDWVCRGRVDAGIYFDACPFESGPEKIEGGKKTYAVIGELPVDSYPPIRVQAGRLNNAEHKAEADRFLHWLVSAQGQKVLQAGGIPPFAGGANPGGGTS